MSDQARGERIWVVALPPGSGFDVQIDRHQPANLADADGAGRSMTITTRCGERM
jgi:hypothetical protein